MVAYRFSFHAYEFMQDLRFLRDAYQRSENALATDLKQAYDEIDAYDARVFRGERENIEWDDEGFVVFDERDFLIYDADGREKAVHSLRKAFAISAFHLWERHARSWTETGHGKFSTLVANASEHTHIDPALVDLHTLVNALKHDSSLWGSVLVGLRPDYFPTGFKRHKNVEWFDTIILTSNAMIDIFAVVERSGPMMLSNEHASYET